MIAGRRPLVYLPQNKLLLPSVMSVYGAPSKTVSNASALVASRAHYMPFVPAYDTGLTSIAFYLAAGTTQNFDLGLYDAAGTRLTSLGSTGIASTTGVRTWTPTTPYSLEAGNLYYAAIACDSATPTFTGLLSSTATNMVYAGLIQGTAFPLPATWTTPTLSGANTINWPFLLLTFSG